MSKSVFGSSAMGCLDRSYLRALDKDMTGKWWSANPSKMRTFLTSSRPITRRLAAVAKRGCQPAHGQQDAPLDQFIVVA